jgi:hypothetical protein
MLTTPALFVLPQDTHATMRFAFAAVVLLAALGLTSAGETQNRAAAASSVRVHAALFVQQHAFSVISQPDGVSSRQSRQQQQQQPSAALVSGAGTLQQHQPAALGPTDSTSSSSSSSSSSSIQQPQQHPLPNQSAYTHPAVSAHRGLADSLCWRYSALADR